MVWARQKARQVAVRSLRRTASNYPVDIDATAHTGVEYVRRLVIRLRHRGAGRLRGCGAVEEHPDGSENSAAEQLRWDYDGGDIVASLAVGPLLPNQAVTLRWEVDREAA